jgi:hypothetical protein
MLLLMRLPDDESSNATQNQTSSSRACEGVFISDARSDGAEIAADLRERLVTEGIRCGRT